MNKNNENIKDQSKSTRSNSGRKKEPGGVQATIERLTGQRPCPDHLRAAANKYLKSDLFPTNHKSKISNKDILSAPSADILLINTLELDQVFQGDTDVVVGIMLGRYIKKDLNDKIENAESEIKRRFEIYSYWMQRIGSLKSILNDDATDLKTERLDMKLKSFQHDSSLRTPAPFALRAIQQLETIEERGRLGRPTADECAEQADAYMALGDFVKADKKAQEAIDVDPNHARAWFVRVMVALKQRNLAISEMQHHQMIATEIAEPMSGQESWAREMADDAANKAADFHSHLREILPKALLHWPKINNKYDHNEERIIVRDLFVDQVFSLVTVRNYSVSNRSLSEINGFGPEWALLNSSNYSAAFMSEVDSKELPLSAEEVDVLMQIAEEYDKQKHYFYRLPDRSYFVKSFKLLHLEWLLNIDTYERHWEDWSLTITHYGLNLFEDYILKDDHLAQLWQMHQIRHGDTPTVYLLLERWKKHTESESGDRVDSILLKRHADLFEYLLARDHFKECQKVAKQAQQLIGGKNSRGFNSSHVMDDQYGIPIQNTLYWEYLETLAVIKDALMGGLLNATEIDTLLDMEKLSSSFGKIEFCFWNCSEEYEEGDGYDYEIAPYGIDLTDKQIWFDAINMQLNLTTPNSYAYKFKDVAEILKQSLMERQLSVDQFDEFQSGG